MTDSTRAISRSAHWDAGQRACSWPAAKARSEPAALPLVVAVQGSGIGVRGQGLGHGRAFLVALMFMQTPNCPDAPAPSPQHRPPKHRDVGTLAQPSLIVQRCSSHMFQACRRMPA